MASKIVKGLALAAGLGLVIGLGSIKRHPGENFENPVDETDLPDDAPAPEPAIERLDRLEARISAVEARPPAAPATDSIAELDLRIERQAKDMEALQIQVKEHREQIDADVAAIDKRFADFSKAIPTVLESIILPRVEDLRAHLRSEMHQSVSSSLTRFERAIDDRVSERIDTLEKALLNQSTIVTTLSQRAVESDMNLQRLISAVERLCERTPGAGPAPRREPSFLDLPSEVPAQPFESAFRPRIVKEDDDPSRRHRTPLTRI